MWTLRQTIIIMTSNAGAQAIVEPKRLGFISDEDGKKDYERMKAGVMEEVRKRLFKPEFLNRIDEIMVFHTLKKEDIQKIVSILLKKLEKRCQEQMNITLRVAASVKEYLAESGFDSKYGARPLRRAIQTKIEDPLANEVSGRQDSSGGSDFRTDEKQTGSFYSEKRIIFHLRDWSKKRIYYIIRASPEKYFYHRLDQQKSLREDIKSWQ